MRREEKVYQVISPLRVKFILSTEYSSLPIFSFFNEERESLFKKLKPRFVGQEVSFPSSDAALLFKLEEVTLLSSGTIFISRGCGNICKIFSNLLNIRRATFSEGKEGLGIECCVLCFVQEEEG